MKYTAAITTLAVGAMAAAVPAPAAPVPTGRFGVMSSRSASPVHLLPLTARGGFFYLGGGPPSSYCPPQVGSACPPGNQTVLAGGDHTLALAVGVPGGQQIYVAPTGELAYTSPHSAYMPAGSVVDKFNRTAPSVNPSFGTLELTQGGLVACPAAPGQGYQVYGQVNGTFGPQCYGFNALTIATNQTGAWQY